MNFAGFVQFFWQSAIFCHNQGRYKAPQETGGKSIKSLLFGEMIKNQIVWFKLAAKSRGYPTTLYDHPGIDPSQAKQLKKLNDKIKSNPALALPSGFVLSKEME